MRYLPLTQADRQAMLAKIGAPSVESLYADVPNGALQTAPIAGLSNHMPEMEVERFIGAMARKNIGTNDVPSFLGAGAYRHHVPASVDHLIQRGEFLTSYTPYQPEVAQGTLQYLFEFQTQVALLTGMDVANASMYDGATSTTEAVAMANRVTRRKKAVLSGGLHPHYREVVETHGRHTGFETISAPLDSTGKEDLTKLLGPDVSCVVIQNPSFFGHVQDLRAFSEAVHAAGALLIVVVTEIVSLGLVISPGEMGADIVTAEGQSIGNPLGFGGPYVGLFAAREKFLRQMPGRLAGQTVDVDGRRGWVLTLSTREQHIRREKATSNICTNAGLCALAFTIHMSLLGEKGLNHLAQLNHANASILADRLASIPGVKLINTSFFNEFTLQLPKPAIAVVEELAQRRILAGVPVARLTQDPSAEQLLLVAATELTTDAEMSALESGLKEVLK